VKRRLAQARNESFAAIRKITPVQYKEKAHSSNRDLVGTGIAGMSAVTIAETFQWLFDVVVPGNHLLPTNVALVMATIIGVWYARTFRA
jgi:hypothetical protein